MADLRRDEELSRFCPTPEILACISPKLMAAPVRPASFEEELE